jgi:hypothetical protein
MSIVSKAFFEEHKNKHNIHRAKYASIDREIGELQILNEPHISESDGLEDIQYFVRDGILYIKGTEVGWDYISSSKGYDGDFFDPTYYEVDERFVKEHEIPKECLFRNKRVGFLKMKRVPFLINIYLNPNRYWVKRKERTPFEYCMQPFKIREL